MQAPVKAPGALDDEVIIFSWIVYESSARRDGVSAEVMADPRVKTDPSLLSFDGKRMISAGSISAGFETMPRFEPRL